jgi:hypothetical protein
VYIHWYIYIFLFYTTCYMYISVYTPFYFTLRVTCISVYLHLSILHSVLHVCQCIYIFLFYTLCYMYISVYTPFTFTLRVSCISVYLHLSIIHSVLHVYHCIYTFLFYTLCYMYISVSTSYICNTECKIERCIYTDIYVTQSVK